MAHFKPLYLLLFTVCGVSVLACVEPPEAAPPICVSDPSENICRRDATADYKSCCDKLNTIEAEQGVPFDEAHQNYFTACIEELEESSSEAACFETEKALSVNWDARRIVGACSSLFAVVSDPGKREADHVLPCINHLTQLSPQKSNAFIPLHAQDPFAIALFCAKLNSTKDAIYTLVSDDPSYTLNCIDVLSGYEWFPADAQNTFAPLSAEKWGSAGNQITTLCAEFLQTCPNNTADSRLSCLSAFRKTPEHSETTTASSFIGKMSLRDRRNTSCYTCDEDNNSRCRHLDYTECQIITDDHILQSECK